MDGDAARRRGGGIAEVARLAGVSTATVSRALSAPHLLRADTLARVAGAVQATGYTPNVAARTLRARRSMVVLVVVPDIGNPFFSEVLRGIEEELSRHGYGLLIGNLGLSRQREAKLVDIVLAGQVDGVLLLNGAVPEGGGRRLDATGIPVVALCEPIAGEDFPQVAVENRVAARAAVAHLAGLGHRRIAYLTGPAGNVLERERRAGFRDGLRLAGLAEGQVYRGDFTFRAGAAAAACFIAESPRPTALFAANDEMAIGFIKTVRDAGVAIPGEVSVVGFDGIDFADFVEPTLTTFRQPRRGLGEAGAALLVRAMAGEAAGTARLRLKVDLLVRDSSGPAPAG